MIMAQPPRGARGGFSFRGMFSLDRLTEGGGGYPLLFQTGESWNGRPLIDRQHPHDLFSELSVSYGRSLGPDAGVFAYFGFPGEPALGPPAFMHRASSLGNPNAPLGHHMQDSTHITFGVLTGGARYKGLKLDASVFTGREPDENRFDFDRPRFDSRSIRMSFNPTDRIALQVSHGFLHSPEALEPGADVRRTTASLMLSHPPRPGADWTTTFVWGVNTSSGRRATHSFMADSEADFGRAAVYARIEYVQRQAHDLEIEELGDRVLPVGALTAGAAWRVSSESRAPPSPSPPPPRGASFTLYPFVPNNRSWSGSSAAWLAHSVRDAGVVGSNPTSPISYHRSPMLIRDLKDCPEFLSGDRAVLRELLHPGKVPLALRYSLAHAVVLPERKRFPTGSGRPRSISSSKGGA